MTRHPEQTETLTLIHVRFGSSGFIWLWRYGATAALGSAWSAGAAGPGRPASLAGGDVAAGAGLDSGDETLSDTQIHTTDPNLASCFFRFTATAQQPASSQSSSQAAAQCLAHKPPLQ